MASMINKLLGKNYNLTAKQERMFLGAVVVVIVVIYGYLAPQCWFMEWGFSPDICQLKCGGFSSGGGSSAGATCGVCTDGSPCDCPAQSCETCTPPEGQLPCGMNGDYACGGYCPYLYSCESLSYVIGGGDTTYSSCACVPDIPSDRDDDGGDTGSSPCYWGLTSLMCGGSCTNGEMCATFVNDAQEYVCGCRSDDTSWVPWPYGAPV